jgi:hypothetical protein
LHGTHTYLLLTRERSLPTPQMCAKAWHMRSASRSTAHNQEAQQTTITCTRARGSKSPRSTVQSRGGHITHQHRKPCDKRAREAQFGATDRDRAMPLPIHKVHQDRDPSRWRRCRRLAAVCCSTHHDGLHERSGLDGTDELHSGRSRISSASIRITAILLEAETAAPWRPARRAHELAEVGSGLQTAFPAPFASVS